MCPGSNLNRLSDELRRPRLDRAPFRFNGRHQSLCAAHPSKHARIGVSAVDHLNEHIEAEAFLRSLSPFFP